MRGTRGDSNHGKGGEGDVVCNNPRMEKRLKELMERIENWPVAMQEEAVAALEAIAAYVCFHEPTHEDR